MAGTILFTLIIGLLAVLQGGINKQFGDSWGLPGAVLINAIVFLVGSIAFYFYAKTSLPLMESLGDRASFSSFKWWYILPGLAGLVYVIGVPYSITKIGALNVFIILIAAQILGSFLWDRFIEGINTNYWQLLAAGLALASAAVLFFKASPN